MNVLNNKNKVAAVVVLYNPDSTVEENILSYIDQVDILFAVDNSSGINKFSKKINREKFIYLPQYKNVGVAEALNIAAHKALEQNYEFLLTMDQDSKAVPNMVEKLLEKTNQKDKIGIISPFHLNNYNSNDPSDGLSEVMFALTSGNLLNLNIFKLLGDFWQELFIDYVDIEYDMRLIKEGFRIIVVNSIPLYHKEAAIVKKRFLGRYFYCFNHVPQRYYYKFRNLFMLREKYRDTFSSVMPHVMNHQFKTLLKAVMFEDQKLQKIKWAILGYYDFLRNRSGECPY